jgi:hypothetical protein
MERAISGKQWKRTAKASPQIAFGPQDQLYLSYTQALDKHHSGNIRFIRSLDGGQTPCLGQGLRVLPAQPGRAVERIAWRAAHSGVITPALLEKLR